MRDSGPPAGSSPSASSVSAAVSVRRVASARQTGGGGGGGGGGGRMLGTAIVSLSWAETCGRWEERRGWRAGKEGEKRGT